MQRIILNILFRLSPKNNIMRMACECRKFQTPGRVTESDQAGFDRLCKLRYKAKPDQRISIKLVLYFADSIFGEQYLNSWISFARSEANVGVHSFCFVFNKKNM